MATILVVDDDPTVLVVIQAALRGAGHTVLAFDHPEDALAEAVLEGPDAAILDVMMPGQSGYDLLGKLQADPRTQGLPVLFLSALDSTPERIRGLREGADDYLGKPFDPEELILRVERLVERSSAAATAQTLVPGSDVPLSQAKGNEDAPLGTGRSLGRYEIVELLGEGSMGTVFRGWDPKLKRTVALKTVKLDLGKAMMWRKDMISRLLNEAVMAARFSHPNIVSVFDVGDQPPNAFIAMEFVEGPSLDQLLGQQDRLTPREVVHLALQVARALAAAHAGDLVHHDVKPGNVMLGPDGIVKVTDFGLANWISEIVENSGRVFGTPGFLAPEALRGEGYSKVSDLFGLGGIMYRCLTGRPPFPGKTIAGIVANTLGGDVAPLRTAVPEVSEDLELLVLGLLERSAERRIPCAQEVVRRLEALLEGPLPEWPREVLEEDEIPKELSDLARSQVFDLARPPMSP